MMGIYFTQVTTTRGVFDRGGLPTRPAGVGGPVSTEEACGARFQFC